MNLTDLLLKETGTYVAVKPVGATTQLIADWMARSGLPNLEPLDDLHVTVLYSRRHVRVTTQSDEFYATPDGWTLFKNPDGTKALVLLLDSPGLTRRHSELIRQGGTHDFPEYVPHLTVSYRFNGSPADLPSLEPIGHGFLFGNEYSEALHE